MNQTLQLNLTVDELKALVKDALTEFEKEKEVRELAGKSYSINGAAKFLKRSHVTICNLIKAGKIATIEDGKRIPAIAINNYLKEN